MILKVFIVVWKTTSRNRCLLYVSLTRSINSNKECIRWTEWSLSWYYKPIIIVKKLRRRSYLIRTKISFLRNGWAKKNQWEKKGAKKIFIHWWEFSFYVNEWYDSFTFARPQIDFDRRVATTVVDVTANNFNDFVAHRWYDGRWSKIFA